MAPLPLSFLPRHVTAASVMRFDDEYPTLICNVAYGSSPDQDTRKRRASIERSDQAEIDPD